MSFENHTIFFYILIALMTIGVLQSLFIGFLFFFKGSGERRANAFYGLLLITIGLTLLHNIFILTDFYHHYPQLNFLPIYYTLAFPTLLFYYVKLTLYPSYKFRLSDVKHFILPGGQLLFFLVTFSKSIEVRSQLDRYFYNPFYGGFEQFLYLGGFFAYMYFAYRYIRRRRKQVKDRRHIKAIKYLNKLLQILFLLFFVHAFMVISDFISFEFFQIDLRHSKVFAGLGIFSFVAVVYWLSIYGFQVLFWGRKVFGK
ncbi:MAG: hypothetical protein HRU41_32175 [Saprospiraceae bacterium]|nr:hypothetical protein [Saprospiraceae bacterium]